MKLVTTKLLSAFLVTALAIPAFAQNQEIVDPTQNTSEQALERGLVPAELLDSSEVQTANDESLLQRRPPGRGGPGRPGPGRPGPGRPGPGRPGPGRPGPRPPHRPAPRQWMCEARDRQGYVYRAFDYDLNRARRESVWTCERQSRSGRCQLLGCR